MRTWLVSAFVAYLSLAGGGMSWATDQRHVIALLAEPVQTCVERRDTDHPLFHGCIDWHSAVHAHWALCYSAKKLAQPPQSLNRLSALGIERELSMLQQSDARGEFFERPYGRAWFLQLARDAEQLWNNASLHRAGDSIYLSLLAYARTGGGNLRSSEYDNGSWYLYQLAKWAKFTGREDNWQEIRNLALFRIRAVPHWPDFHRVRGFFAPKALALLLAQELKGDEEIALLEGIIQGESLSPIHFPVQTAHQGGLNYSRAWGLWALYQATGKPIYLQAYHAHLDTMLQERNHWIEDYQRYGHWVAQFGLFAHRLADDLNP